MVRKFFGTDGIRGTANSFPMTADIAQKVGMAAGSYFTKGKHRHRVIIGKDTRLSGYMVETALTSGFLSVGMDVMLVGPMPTPAVAMLTKSLRADLGVMISASHNPYHDNGIKLFDHKGFKLSDETELEIEQRMQGDLSPFFVEPEKLGRAKRLDDAPGRYVEFVKRTFPKEQKLTGIRIVLDCANGAGYHIGPDIFWELGAEVIPLGVNPNGFNINKDCGSTSPEILCKEVIKQKADIGIALDGDSDRIIVCDEKGKIVDGDQIMAVIAKNQLDKGTLQGSGIVATNMSNLGLEKHLEKLGLSLQRTKVGDRYVWAHMCEYGYNIGGEQSGHIIIRDYTTTGDAIIAALQLLSVLVKEQQAASKIFRPFKPFPQILKNVAYNRKQKDPLKDANVKAAITKHEKALDGNGRLFIRKSGTEPLIRIMVEGTTKSAITAIADDIAAAMEKASS